MNVSDLVEAMERIAPTCYAEEWDNVGLLAGDPAASVTKVGLCIDYTPAVACEMAGAGVDAVVAYHPPIFKPIKKLVGGPIFDAIRRGVAIYSPHTALDVAPGGTNDVLADAVGMTAERQPLRPTHEARRVKLVTFVPPDAAEKVADALFHAGAGQIGDYAKCSFRSAGTGTFQGGAETNPAVGEAGRFEMVDELKLEVLLDPVRLPEAVAALRAAHPYEEPAVDVVALEVLPGRGGLGRLGPLSQPAPRSVVLQRLKEALHLDHLLVAGPTDGDVQTVAVCAGSCGDLLHDAQRLGADLYVTGEMRHHDALAATKHGMTVACTLHSHSERATLAVLVEKLRAALGVDVVRPASDRDPFGIV